MKRTWIIASLAAVALTVSPASYANHDKDCKATHGTVSAKSGNSITVNGKTYTLESDTPVTREDGATAGLTAIHTGDKVCIETKSADSRDLTKVMVLDTDSKVASSSSSDARDHSYASGERSYAREKLSDLEQKAHEKMCKGHHGTVTDKTANTISIDGKTYALSINTPVNKQEEPLLPKTVKSGDRVCYVTKEASDGSQQITKLIALDKSSDDKVRVREKDTSDTTIKESKDSPSKVEVETPHKEIEVK